MAYASHDGKGKTNLELQRGSYVLWIYTRGEECHPTLETLIRDGIRRKEHVILVGEEDTIKGCVFFLSDGSFGENVSLFTVAGHEPFSIHELLRFIEEKGSLFRIISFFGILHRTRRGRRYVTMLPP